MNKTYLKDLQLIQALPTQKKYQKLVLFEYPFDLQLLSQSSLYVRSRELYRSLEGTYQARMCSTMRSLRSQDLFADVIDYTPSATQYEWFTAHSRELADPELEIAALTRFNEISIYHEQNHRILWRLLPPAPTEKRDLCRYLNFAESLVVTLDLAFGDELGKNTSNALERLKLIYRPGGEHKWYQSTAEEYRSYLLALLCTTYMTLEMVLAEDTPKALDYLFPGQKKMNKEAAARGLELSELFTQNTNPQWQNLKWQEAAKKLKSMHKGSEIDPLYMPEDPLDLEEEFFWAHRVFDFYGL